MHSIHDLFFIILVLLYSDTIYIKHIPQLSMMDKQFLIVPLLNTLSFVNGFVPRFAKVAAKTLNLFAVTLYKSIMVNIICIYDCNIHFMHM